ncbi:hypothetical protein [Kitasatospora sp. NPDC002965]|uniref:hypothetical protein n=1 Tax=Kitasatospora sp. NPDC002965 TaxID=3154775 RepID=UPI0033AA1DEC
MTSLAPHSAHPPHGYPVCCPAHSAAAAVAEGRLPVGPTGDLPGVPAGPTGPWSVRSVRAGRSRGRTALEVYEYGELVDVLVASRLGAGLLRGARCWKVPNPGGRGGAGRFAGSGRRRVRHGLAWGRLPRGGAAPSVGFTAAPAAGRLLRRPGRSAPVVEVAEVVTVAGQLWLAWAEGVFGGVLVETADGAASERRPLERVRHRAGADALAECGGAG